MYVYLSIKGGEDNHQFCFFCREIRSNDVINWTSDDSIVTFMPNRTYIFDPDTSCAGCNDKNDTFVTANIPLLVSISIKRVM